MKKIISIVISLLICVSQFSFVSAATGPRIKTSVLVKSEKFLDVNISVPYFEGFTSADKVNKIIKSTVENSLKEVNKGAMSIQEINDNNTKKEYESISWKNTLDMSYDYFLNKDILSVKLNNYTYMGGAHGMSYIIPITMNIQTGQIYEFKDLFKEEKIAKEKIQNKLIQTIKKNPENYFPEYEQSIKEKNGNFNFYLDGNKLIVYFDLYDIAPYASGIHHFIFESNELKDILKEEIYNSIKGANSLEGILFNGTNFKSQEIILDKDSTPMIPLRTVAESLGYKIDWNKKDGPIVNGNTLKNISCETNKGAIYVPLEYFTDILKENVSLGFSQYVDTHENQYSLNKAIVIRVFDKNNSIKFQ